MGRWLVRILAAMSLLIWVAVAVAWPVSYWKRVLVSRSTGYSVMAFNLNYGQLVLARFGVFRSAAPVIYNWGLEAPVDALKPPYLGMGFSWSGGEISGTRTATYRTIAIPLWLPFVIFSWPIIPWMRHRRRAALPGNACKQCGYDLRATPQRCPECGIIPGKSPPVARPAGNTLYR